MPRCVAGEAEGAESRRRERQEGAGEDEVGVYSGNLLGIPMCVQICKRTKVGAENVRGVPVYRALRAEGLGGCFVCGCALLWGKDAR